MLQRQMIAQDKLNRANKLRFMNDNNTLLFHEMWRDIYDQDKKANNLDQLTAYPNLEHEDTTSKSNSINTGKRKRRSNSCEHKAEDLYDNVKNITTRRQSLPPALLRKNKKTARL